MTTFKQLNNLTKTALVAGLVLMIYGYLCRLTDLYFFWESKSIGWVLLFAGVIGFLLTRIKTKRAVKKNTLLEKIGIGIIAFSLLVTGGLVVIMPFTDAYAATKKYLTNNQALKSEVGNIKNFSLLLTGGIQKTSDSSGEYGNATINLIVKGDKKFKDVALYVVKTADSPEWQVMAIE